MEVVKSNAGLSFVCLRSDLIALAQVLMSAF